MQKYSKRMILVHWLTLLLVLAALVLGNVASEARHAGNATLANYMAHMLVGGVILLLTLVRFFFRSKDGVPPPLGDTPADKVAKLVHYLLYAVLVLLPLTGMMQVVGSDVAKAIAAGDAALLPARFDGVAAHEIHELLVFALVVLVAIHVLGALKHQFVLKDGLMDRMSLKDKP